MKNLEHTTELQNEESIGLALPALAPGEVILGTLVAIDPQGQPMVNYPQRTDENSVTAVSTLAVTPAHIGRQVALLFANGDPQKPIIMGFIYSPLYQMLDGFSLLDHPSIVEDSGGDQDIFPNENVTAELKVESPLATETIRVDGKKVVIEGEEEVVLTCGESSITLTKAGKIIIRGKYLVSRASSVNRILGGSVQVN